jgi:hypothetical protein
MRCRNTASLLTNPSEGTARMADDIISHSALTDPLALKRLPYLRAIHYTLLNGMVRLSQFPDIHAHVDAALRATRERIMRHEAEAT